MRHLHETPELPLGAWLRWKRRQRTQTQAEAAAHFGVSQATYSRWEIGEHQPASARYGAVAEYLESDVAAVWAASTRGLDAPTGSPDTIEQVVGQIDLVITELGRHVDQLRALIGG